MLHQILLIISNNLISYWVKHTFLFLHCALLMLSTLELKWVKLSRVLIQSPTPASCWIQTAAEVLINAFTRKQTRVAPPTHPALIVRMDLFVCCVNTVPLVSCPGAALICVCVCHMAFCHYQDNRSWLNGRDAQWELLPSTYRESLTATIRHTGERNVVLIYWILLKFCFILMKPVLCRMSEQGVCASLNSFLFFF